MKVTISRLGEPGAQNATDRKSGSAALLCGEGKGLRVSGIFGEAGREPLSGCKGQKSRWNGKKILKKRDQTQQVI